MSLKMQDISHYRAEGDTFILVAYKDTTRDMEIATECRNSMERDFMVDRLNAHIADCTEWELSCNEAMALAQRSIDTGKSLQAKLLVATTDNARAIAAIEKSIATDSGLSTNN